MSDSVSVLVVAMLDDYGQPERGPSLEYYNLLLPIQRIRPDSLSFDFMARLNAVGVATMNAELVELVRRVRPAVTIVALYGEQITPATIEAIKPYSTTVAYFWDDIWRRAYSFRWARSFDFVTTSDPDGVRRFAAAGCPNAIFSPFAFNEDLYRREKLPKAHEVSFVGGYHPYREWLIRRLRRAGHRVTVYGHRWPEGRISLDGMVKLFNASAINLNLSNSSHWELDYVFSTPRAIPWMLKMGKDREQVKARHFEIAGCGGFQLSYEVDYLARYFEPGREVAVFRSASELLAKVRYFLDHPDEREALADAGWRRAHADHTASRRYEQLLADVTSKAADRR